MEGAHGAFCVTNFWEHLSPTKELVQAHTMAQAALDAGVKHVVWSTLEDTREFVAPGSRMPVLMGKYNVPHFDGKGEANRAFIDRGLPTTLLYTSYYWDNLIHFGMQPQRGADGVLASCCRWAKQRCRVSPPPTSARARSASSRAARS